MNLKGIPKNTFSNVLSFYSVLNNIKIKNKILSKESSLALIKDDISTASHIKNSNSFHLTYITRDIDFKKSKTSNTSTSINIKLYNNDKNFYLEENFYVKIDASNLYKIHYFEKYDIILKDFNKKGEIIKWNNNIGDNYYCLSKNSPKEIRELYQEIYYEFIS